MRLINAEHVTSTQLQPQQEQPTHEGAGGADADDLLQDASNVLMTLANCRRLEPLVPVVVRRKVSH